MGEGLFNISSGMFHRSRITGVTLVELVVVILLTGIIAAFAAPRFFNRSDFTGRGYFEQTLAAVRYGQKLAIVSGCDIQVSLNSSGYSLNQWINGASCSAANSGAGLTPVQQAGGGSFSSPPPTGVTITGGALFYFDAIGRPRAATPGPTFGGLLTARTNITIGGRTLTIEPETGYSRCFTGC